jgi:hypothetical protein
MVRRVVVWDDVEMREVEVEPPVRLGRGLASGLRAEVSGLGLARARAGLDEVTRGAGVVFAPSAEASSHGNFVDASWRRIMANPAWARRLGKAHTAKRQARATGPDESVRDWRELDAATSSDALLMNVFCYPRVWTVGLRALLGVDGTAAVEFGVRASAPLQRGHVNTTEIDMRVGDLLVEAKLTEADFQFGALRLVERYVDLDSVFEREKLEVTRRGVRSYQLIRGVLAAHAAAGRFCVLCDARRVDLVEDWFRVMGAVKSFELQSRLRLVTWQEIAALVPGGLSKFLEVKYGIAAKATPSRRRTGASSSVDRIA